jgi:hypothetical protein
LLVSVTDPLGLFMDSALGDTVLVGGLRGSGRAGSGMG